MPKSFVKMGNWVLFFVILFSFFFFLSFLKNNITVKDSEIRSVKTEESKLTEVIKKTFNKEVSSAEEAEIYNQQQFNLAIVNNEPCKQIDSNSPLRQKCDDVKHYQSAIGKKQPNQCRLIINTDLKITCNNEAYLALALQDSREDFCLRISDENLKNQCINHFHFLFVASENKDCSEIKNKSQLESCLDYKAYKKAVDQNSEALCHSIQKKDLLENCKEEISQVKKVESLQKAILNHSDNTYSCKDQECLDLLKFKESIGINSTKDCSKIKNRELTLKCQNQKSLQNMQFYLNRALSTQEKKWCELITNVELKESCLNELIRL